MRKVMVIDGEPQMRRMLCDLFSHEGFRVTAVSHGVEAAQAMRRDVPDVILLDQDVQIGGIRTARIIRMNPRYDRIPILMGLRAGSSDAVRQVLKDALHSGVSWVLARPYHQRRLMEKVQECLNAATSGLPACGPGTAVFVGQSIRKRVRLLTDLPTLSPAQQRMIAIMSCEDSEVDVGALIETMRSDQALTMRTMRIARSAAYGFRGNSLDTAIPFLGVQKIRQIVQSATVLEVFNGRDADSGLDLNAFWAHSVACGMVMQQLCRDNKQSGHFTAGLLHDVGKLVLHFSFPEYSRAVGEIAVREGRLRNEVESELLGISHAEMGQELATSWQLPSEIAESIAHHHAPSIATRHQYLSSLVYLADVAVRQMQIGDSGNGAEPCVEDPYAQKVEHRFPLEKIGADRENLARHVEAVVAP